MLSTDSNTEQVAGWVSAAERIVVFSGAGLSKASGISTYRDAGGLWTQGDNLRFASADGYRADPKGFLDFRAARRKELAAASPNAAHIALSELQRRKPSTVLATQNIDGLLTKAGASEVLELHGNLTRQRCTACGANDPKSESGRCLECGHTEATVRPDVVMFGEALNNHVIARAELAAKRCQLLIAVGTSALVYPAAGLIDRAKSRGARVAVINMEPIDHDVDLQLIGAAEELLPAVISALPAHA